MRSISEWISAPHEHRSNGAVVIAGAILLAMTAVGVPAAAVWVGSTLATEAPQPVFYVAAE